VVNVIDGCGVNERFWYFAAVLTNVHVVVTVKARLEGMDRHIEEAAMDLGATEWTTFRKITLPMIAPGVAAAAMLSASLSIDDYVITSFNAGQTQTFPLFIFGATRQGVPPEVNVWTDRGEFNDQAVAYMCGADADRDWLSKRDRARAAEPAT
jgi:ABC-type spermidine/putrescine transport system permease subunit II